MTKKESYFRLLTVSDEKANTKAVTQGRLSCLQGLRGFSRDSKCGAGIDKYIDGIRDLTAPREAGLATIWARRDAGFF